MDMVLGSQVIFNCSLLVVRAKLTNYTMSFCGGDIVTVVGSKPCISSITIAMEKGSKCVQCKSK
jgi:uncharacterized membrane protein